MKNKPLDIAGFLKLVIDTLETAGVDYLIGGAIAEWAGGEPRATQVDYGPPIGTVYIHSPEDLILYKLIYFGLSQQSKHSRDIAAILKSKKNDLDLDYIEQWTARLGLSSL